MERYDDSCCSTRRVNEREITPPLPYRAYIVYKHTRAPNQCVCTYVCIYTQSERERERDMLLSFRSASHGKLNDKRLPIPVPSKI